MKRLYIGAIIAAAVFTACKGDPTSSLRNGPSRIDLSANQIFIDPAASKQFVVVVRDDQGDPLSAAVAVSSSNASVFTVAVDTTAPPVNGTTHNYVLTGVASGNAVLRVSSGGLKDSALVTTN